MKKTMVALTLAVVAAIPVLAEPRTSGVSQKDAAAIVALAHESDVAWDSKDADRMIAVFTPDGHNRILGTPVDLRGREAMKSYFTTMFAKRQGTMRHVTNVVEIQKVTDGVAFADAEVVVEQQGADGSWTPLRRFVGTSVVVKDGGKWLIKVNRVRPEPMEQKKG